MKQEIALDGLVLGGGVWQSGGIMMTTERKRFAVIGGGISGLAAALHLRELRPEAVVTLFEGEGRLGGVLETVARDGYLFEGSADGFITNVPWGIEFCQRVGLADELMTTDESRRQAFVVCRGKLQAIPKGFVIMVPHKIKAVLASPILSMGGKIRLLREYSLSPRVETTDESVGAFATRRLGREAYERLVQPLVGGIYSADPMRLSLAATMPQFAKMEQEKGGLIRAARAARGPGGVVQEKSSGARYSMFASLRRGMGSLVEAAQKKLPAEAVRLNSRVTKIERVGERGAWRVFAGRGGEGEVFDGVILATPGPATVPLLKSLHPTLAGAIGEIDYAGTAVVSVCYRREQIKHALDGFGFVSPFIEKRAILAGSFLSQKYEGRAPAGQVLIRVFVGGATHPESVTLPEMELRSMVHGELAELLGITGGPVAHQVSRWERKMPQYHVGHMERVAGIEQAAATLPGFALAGNAYRGVGVPACIHSGEVAAERVLAGQVG